MLINTVLTQIQFILPNFEHVLAAYLILITFGKYDRFEIVSNMIVSKKRICHACMRKRALSVLYICEQVE